ncbi:hypothetical protein [Nocardia sp. NBC_01327]|uniref:hypothetical protein n=1 Tax=Nocardia sp. NBC_01327 TaxID=2903593 RepID=UPI002E11800B|nr:hypothetical protein OG326_07615 [Nocardia sp. NBC_01327]
MRNSLWLTGFGVAAAAVLGTAGTASAAGSVMDHDGPYTVNTDISAGYYTTHNPAPDCQWVRLGADGDIIERGDGGNGNQTVRITSQDTTFATSHCGTWAIDGGRGPATGPQTGTGSFGF